MTEDVSRRSIAGAAGVVIFALALAFTLLAAAPPAAANNATPNTYGKTISNWGHAWWQWAARFSAADNPIAQDGFVDCTAGQSGAVWFLAGTGGGTVERTCSVKQGKALFFPIGNSIAWSDDDSDLDECRAVAAQYIDPAPTWTCEVDGIPCIYTNQVVRAQSDPLPFDIPGDSWLAVDEDGELLNTPGLWKPSISDGYWVMLPPLSRGEHTIRFTYSRSGFELDVTYHLTVTSRP
jgi:hypothetical protein